MLKNLRLSALLSVVLVAFIALDASAQTTDNVGIGTTTPHPSVILDVNYENGTQSGNPAKGVRLPFVSTIQRLQMYNAYGGDIPNGLLVYDTDLGAFMYYKWDTPIQGIPVSGQWVQVASQVPVVNSNVPVGGIIMWSGLISNIPSGWTLCNGSNGSPDLTDKFIISVASAAENPGTAPVNGFFVDVEPGATVAPDRRFFKLAYIMKL